MQPGRTALEAILDDCGISLRPDQLDRLWGYHRLLRAANARLNLTRIHNFENMVLKHYADSLLVLGFLELPSPLIDMGSGPGLPGVPLAIARPQTHVILAEPRGVRADFLGEVKAKLRLSNVEVYARKLGRNYPGCVQGVISRAVGPVAETLDRVAACLEPGGRMIFMKGPDCDAEVAEARRSPAAEPGGTFRLAADYAYAIPGTPHRRRLLVYERSGGSSERRAASGEWLPRSDEASPGKSALAGGLVPSRIGMHSPLAARRSPLPNSAQEISSESNPSFRLFRELLSGRGIRKHDRAILAGPRIVAEILAKAREHALAWITDLKMQPEPAGDVPAWYRLSSPLFQELDVAGTKAPLLLVSIPPLAAWSDDGPWPGGCTLFIPFQDPENVGAAIRSAAAFGVARVVLLREAAHPFHPRAARAAGSALFQVPLLQGPSIRELRSGAVPLIALDLDPSMPELHEAPFPPAFGLVAGIEGPGLPEHLRSGERRRIAMSPEVDSLNAATAAAIALYAWSRQGAKSL
jgi:16S rRNA (guanine527-N7)-methyltransferase